MKLLAFLILLSTFAFADLSKSQEAPSYFCDPTNFTDDCHHY